MTFEDDFKTAVQAKLELKSNKKTDFTDVAASGDVTYPTRKAVADELTKYGVTITKQTTPDTGYDETIVFKQGGTELYRYNTLKDRYTQNADIKTVTTADDPYPGAVVGEKYLELDIKAGEDGEIKKKLYIPVKELFTVELGTSDTVSLYIDGATSKIMGKVVDASIGTTQLTDGGVTTAKIADGGVSTAKIADGGVTSGKLANGSVGTNALAANAVETANIKDEQVTGGTATTKGKIAAATIESYNLSATCKSDAVEAAIVKATELLNALP